MQHALWTSLVTTLGFLISLCPDAHALAFRAYDSQRHDRFLNFPGAPIHNTNFIHASTSLTGVGWWIHSSSGQRRGITMVSPIHYVGATHSMPPGAGTHVSFVSSNEVVRTYLIAAQTHITNDDGQISDLSIGTLSEPVPSSDHVGFHPYSNLRNELSYYGKSVILLGKNGQGASEKINNISNTPTVSGINRTRALKMTYNTISGDGDEAYYNNGDSGSPVFVKSNNGVATIVGTNSALSSRRNLDGSTTYSCFASFVPHYVDKLNHVMAAKGYRMTKANPGSTSLSLNRQLTPTVSRAGHPFTISLKVYNTGALLAENIKLTNTFPANTTVQAASGVDWFDESSSSAIMSRKASIADGASGLYSITVTVPAAGTVQHQVTYTCDQSPLTTEHFNIHVIESFLSWSTSLVNKSAGGDDDHDGINNLLEYAFGGDPTLASQRHPNGEVRLLPQYQSGGVSYLRRTDANARALTYQLQTSTTLEDGSWSHAGNFISDTSTTAIDADFELVTHTLTTPTNDRFFRIEIMLSE